MARNKYPELTVEKILDVAQKLFLEQGYEQTTIQDIVNNLGGMTKGAVYHHFKSKEDILDAMIERMSRQLIKKAADIFNQKDIPVLQRLTMMMMALNVDGNLGQEVMDQVHKPQNALLHQKMQIGLLTGINPLITSLIEEGIAQGICQTDFPAEVAEMTLLYSNAVFDDLMQYSEDERQQKVTAFIYNLERLLGMERGSMQAAILPIFQNDQQK